MLALPKTITDTTAGKLNNNADIIKILSPFNNKEMEEMRMKWHILTAITEEETESILSSYLKMERKIAS